VWTIHRDKKDVKTEPPTGQSREAVVAAKQSAAAREYHAYTAKNGGGLDRDWDELLNFITNHRKDLDEVEKKIDAFRAKMRE
jgi:hypothetical protein